MYSRYHAIFIEKLVGLPRGMNLKERFTLVTSAVELTGLQMVEEVRSAVPAAGRVPRPEAAAGLGGVPSVDGQPDPADQPAQ